MVISRSDMTKQVSTPPYRKSKDTMKPKKTPKKKGKSSDARRK